MDYTQQDFKFMRLAIKLAEKARGNTSPNPLVGAVIVKNGKLISTGYHKKPGLPHAEIEAINAIGDKRILKGSKLYVSLEPCSHYGKTPPCTDAIIKYGFSHVIAACLDPNPMVCGKGIGQLQKAEIKASYGLLSRAAQIQNEAFFKHIKTKMPFIALKIAASIDGKTASKTMDSKWITGQKARMHVQQIRYGFDCILTGINTVLADDPLLYPRDPSGNPLKGLEEKIFVRAILDSGLKISPDSKIAGTAGVVKTVIFIEDKKNSIKKLDKKIGFLEKMGLEIIMVPSVKKQKNIAGSQNKLDLNEVLKILYDKFKVTSIIAECGQTLSSELLENNFIDKFLIFIAPKIIGCDSPFGMFKDLDIIRVSDAVKIKFDSIKKIGEDILINAYPGCGTIF